MRSWFLPLPLYVTQDRHVHRSVGSTMLGFCRYEETGCHCGPAEAGRSSRELAPLQGQGDGVAPGVMRGKTGVALGDINGLPLREM